MMPERITNFSKVSRNDERLTTTDGVGSFLVHYGQGSTFNSSQLTLSAFALTGDFNSNGVVEAADYVVLRKGLGTIYMQNDYNIFGAPTSA
jgi:hypothetical protein